MLILEWSSRLSDVACMERRAERKHLPAQQSDRVSPGCHNSSPAHTFSGLIVHLCADSLLALQIMMVAKYTADCLSPPASTLSTPLPPLHPSLSSSAGTTTPTWPRHVLHYWQAIVATRAAPEITAVLNASCHHPWPSSSQRPRPG